ncbi:MAG: hypothetical protein UY23_C0001G0120 [Candidatus Jorgensenbacteria bacterium GW2011_GWA1_48_11]|uniref:DedA family protein n=1 Tax=Candidatus Jorgensenbacteria bacterium GW2011_GWA1_48_11 TaxID=1618660 RepID=A0A0G1UBL9_9BACT|nr:MAG: hypothetical protein UY23_C0001G0120 [Candidatus Jorgensenbacteria bacterium GW2011_GWA1_48_11]KKW12007.1 MAG: hypothetical protein UY51_C0005G0249 [Candidatus Jorgensenbacteria bacterium GW2011_GWB1_49_9]
MSNLLDLLGNWVIQYYGWRYLIIGLGLTIQEEITIIVSVYLLSNHYLSWLGFLLTLAATFFIYEMFFYLSGRYIRNTFLGRYIERKIPNYAKLQFQLHKNATVFLILSRFVMYLNTGVLFLSGWSGLGFKKLIKARVVANIFWLGGLVILSYFSLSAVNALLAHRAEIAVVVFLVLILTIQYIIKKAILEENQAGSTLSKKPESPQK